MTSPLNIESLRKILKLEHQKGYTDTAVFGGLDKFLKNWAGQATESITDPQLLNRFHKLHLVNPKYASLTKQQRKEWVKAMLDFLAGEEIREAEGGKAKLAPVANQPSSRSRVPRTVVSGSIDSPITVIRGISSGLATKFSKLGVKTCLLYTSPSPRD